MNNICRIVNSVIKSCTYIISEPGAESIYVVDPGDAIPVLNSVGKSGCLKGVFLTHVHYDHIYGLNELVMRFPEMPVYTIADGKDALSSPRKNLSRFHYEMNDFIFSKPENVITMPDDGCSIKIYDDLEIIARPTPGHDVTCVSYFLDNIIFSGDSYIPGCKLIKNFPRSNSELAVFHESELKRLEQKGYSIYPGHAVDFIEQ